MTTDKEKLKEKLKKQLKMTSSAIDLIKMSQRSQHTSIKEAMKKMLRCISMLAEVEIEEKKIDLNDKPLTKLLKEIKVKKIKERLILIKDAKKKGEKDG